jgi:alpha-tubulin suppressor-like RCC1 family protein
VPLDAGAVSGVAAGFDSTCVVTAAGDVWCWGYNVNGELGHDGGVDAGDGNCCIDVTFCGFKSCTGVPSKVKGLGPTKSVAVGCSHACALENDGTVWCWGANDKGQLGTGDNTGAGFPRQVSGLTHATGLTLGCDTSCAWDDAGVAWCWGGNAQNELGNGSPTNASSPAKVSIP